MPHLLRPAPAKNSDKQEERSCRKYHRVYKNREDILETWKYEKLNFYTLGQKTRRYFMCFVQNLEGLGPVLSSLSLLVRMIQLQLLPERGIGQRESRVCSILHMSSLELVLSCQVHQIGIVGQP